MVEMNDSAEMIGDVVEKIEEVRDRRVRSTK